MLEEELITDWIIDIDAWVRLRSNKDTKNEYRYLVKTNYIKKILVLPETVICLVKVQHSSRYMQLPWVISRPETLFAQSQCEGSCLVLLASHDGWHSIFIFHKYRHLTVSVAQHASVVYVS